MDFRGVVTEIIRETSYRLEHFYIRSYLDGGLTYSQVSGLYDELQKCKDREFKIQAALHGVDLSKDSNAEGKKESTEPTQSAMLFGDPEEYSHLSQKEKEDLTEKMMKKHKAWAGDSILG